MPNLPGGHFACYTHTGRVARVDHLATTMSSHSCRLKPKHSVRTTTSCRPGPCCKLGMVNRQRCIWAVDVLKGTCRQERLKESEAMTQHFKACVCCWNLVCVKTSPLQTQSSRRHWGRSKQEWRSFRPSDHVALCPPTTRLLPSSAAELLLQKALLQQQASMQELEAITSCYMLRSVHHTSTPCFGVLCAPSKND